MPRKNKPKPTEVTTVVPQEPTVVNDATRWVVQDGKPDMIEILPNGIALIQQMARNGHNRMSIAAALKIGKSTFNSCVKRQPEVEEALEVGRAGLDHEVHDRLYQLGCKGNVVALIFLAKCRLGWRETEPEDVRPNIVINLPGAASPQTWKPPAFATPTPPQLKEGDDE